MRSSDWSSDVCSSDLVVAWGKRKDLSPMPLLRIETANNVTTLTIDRAETMNPLGASGDGDAFAAACDAINLDMGVRCVILTGAGRAFSAGGDIKAMQIGRAHV